MTWCLRIACLCTGVWNIPVACRDDQGRLALHWAAASGHTELVALLLGAAAAQKAAVEAAPDEAEPALMAMVGKPVHEIQVAFTVEQQTSIPCTLNSAEVADQHNDVGCRICRAPNNLPWSASPQKESPALCLGPVQDKQGNAALHMAARRTDTEVLKMLLDGASKESLGIVNNLKETPLHWAARGNYIDAARLLFHAAPQMRAAQDIRGFTPWQWAQRCGHDVSDLASCALMMSAGCLPCRDMQSAAKCQNALEPAPAALYQALAGMAASRVTQGCSRATLLTGDVLQVLAAVLRSEKFHKYEEPEGRGQTIVLAPPECHEHKTSPEPVVRGGREAPPENVHRLHVLTDSGKALASSRC